MLVLFRVFRLTGSYCWFCGVTQDLYIHLFVGLLQDKVIAIPREFYIDTVIGDIASSLFQFKCNIDDNDMR